MKNKFEVHWTVETNRTLYVILKFKQLREITELIEVGKIKPIIGKVYDFKETQKALEYSESGRAKGKIIVKMEDE